MLTLYIFPLICD